jgi:hypothetical protein
MVPIRKNEAYLFGNYYPLIGGVQRFNASGFAAKQTFGDVTKDDELLYSNWSTEDQRGGIGIKDAIEDETDNMCWFSNCTLIQKGHILLPPLVTEAGNPTTAGDDVSVMVEYANAQYVVFATDVRSWGEGSSSFSTSLQTLSASPTDAIVHKGKLYFAVGPDFQRYDGSSWTNGTTLGTAVPTRFFQEWDDKLFTIDNDGQLSYTVDEGVTWIQNALSNKESDSFTSLFQYRNAAGDFILYLGTREGLLALDFDNARWAETELKSPKHDYAGAGANAWRDAAFIPVGLQISRYRTNPVDQALMGLDRRDGIPVEYRGSIIQLLPAHHELIAIVDATSKLTQTLYGGDFGPVSGGAYGGVQILDSEGQSGIFQYNDIHNAWYNIYTASAASTPAKFGSVSTADGEYRLWFAMDSSVYFMKLQDTSQNPQEIADFEFAASGTHILSWFNANSDTTKKTIARFHTRVTDLVAETNYVKFYYGTDNDDSTWTLFTNDDFPDGVVDVDGTHEFRFATGGKGLEVDSVRIKAELTRGSTSTTISPDIRWQRVQYLKRLEVRYGFKMRIDCSKNYRFKRTQTLEAALKEALASNVMGDFQFQSSESHNVMMVPPFEGMEAGGSTKDGIYDVVLVAP